MPITNNGIFEKKRNITNYAENSKDIGYLRHVTHV